jgi:hypothetical protein
MESTGEAQWGMAPKKLDHPPADASALFGGAFCVTDKQAAAYLNISTRSVHNMIADGRLQRVYPNPRSSRITVESLTGYRDALLRGQLPKTWAQIANPYTQPVPEPSKRRLGLLERWGLNNS